MGHRIYQPARRHYQIPLKSKIKTYNLCSFFSIDDFIYNLRDFVHNVRVDAGVLTDCTTVINSFALSMTIFTKFEDLWKLIGFKDRYVFNQAYAALFNLF